MIAYTGICRFTQNLHLFHNYLIILQVDIAAVKSELSTTTGALQQTINLQEERLAAVRDSATKTSNSVAEVEATFSALKGEIRALQNKCEDLENRSRRRGQNSDSIYLQFPKRPVES